MQYYRCKCGDAQAWGSMSPAPCRGCAKCGTTLEFHPDYHKAPAPHEWVTRFEADPTIPPGTVVAYTRDAQGNVDQRVMLTNIGEVSNGEEVSVEECGECHGTGKGWIGDIIDARDKAIACAGQAG